MLGDTVKGYGAAGLGVTGYGLGLPEEVLPTSEGRIKEESDDLFGLSTDMKQPGSSSVLNPLDDTSAGEYI